MFAMSLLALELHWLPERMSTAIEGTLFSSNHAKIIFSFHFKNFISAVCICYKVLIVYMWYTRKIFYSEAAEENLQEAKIACDIDSPWTYNIDIDRRVRLYPGCLSSLIFTCLFVQGDNDCIMEILWHLLCYQHEMKRSSRFLIVVAYHSSIYLTVFHQLQLPCFHSAVQ